MARAKCFILAMLVLMATFYCSNAALTCPQVFGALAPCMSYLSGGQATSQCCEGVRDTLAAANTTPARRTICGCLKDVANGVAGSYLTRAAALPAECDVNVPYKIDLKTDCNRIN